MPRLAVLMPVRNAAEFLVPAVSSTLRSLPLDSALHIHDDGSSDASWCLLQGRADRDRRIRLSRSPFSQGVAATLNLLIAQSDSALVARMDGDDICLPWRFRQQMRALDHGWDVAFTSIVPFEEHLWRPRHSILLRASPEAAGHHLTLGNPFAHSTMMTRRTVLDDLGGYRETASEDYDLWLRASAAGVVLGRLGAPGLLYRNHRGQVTRQADWRSRREADGQLARTYARVSSRATGLRVGSDWLAELRRIDAGVRPVDPPRARTILNAVLRQTWRFRRPDRFALRVRVRHLLRVVDARAEEET